MQFFQIEAGKVHKQYVARVIGVFPEHEVHSYQTQSCVFTLLSDSYHEPSIFIIGGVKCIKTVIVFVHKLVALEMRVYFFFVNLSRSCVFTRGHLIK